ALGPRRRYLQKNTGWHFPAVPWGKLPTLPCCLASWQLAPQGGRPDRPRGEERVTVRIDCPHCGTRCQVPDEHRSKPVRCYKCKQVFSATPPQTEEVPLPDFDAPPEPAAPLPCRLEVGWATSRGRVRD